MIVLSGYYGFGNAGDEAIALAIAAELRRRGEEVNILSAEPAKTTKLTEGLGADGLGAKATPRMQPLALGRAFFPAKALWLGGGGLLQDSTSKKSLLYYLTLARTARTLGKRVVVFNQSVGPLSPWGREQVRSALGGVPAIVRDKGSAGLLRELGFEPRVGGDPALLLAPSVGGSAGSATILLAPRGDQHAATAALTELAASLRAEGHSVRAAALYPAQDREAALALDPQALLSSDPHEVLALISQSRFVLGVRLHALILAAAAGVPFAGISYDPKVSGFCLDAGAPCFEMGTPAEALAPALAQQPDWEAVAAMKARARESFAWALA